MLFMPYKSVCLPTNRKNVIMSPSWLFLSALVVFVGAIQAASGDGKLKQFCGRFSRQFATETRPHVKDLHRKSHHFHKSAKHHKGLKTRASNSSSCISVFEPELISSKPDFRPNPGLH